MTRYTLHPDVTDVLITDDGGLALTQDSLLDLGPLSQVLIAACDPEPQTLEALVAVCIETFGTPEASDPQELVADVLRQLLDVGLLQEAP